MAVPVPLMCAPPAFQTTESLIQLQSMELPVVPASMASTRMPTKTAFHVPGHLTATPAASLEAPPLAPPASAVSTGHSAAATPATA